MSFIMMLCPLKIFLFNNIIILLEIEKIGKTIDKMNILRSKLNDSFKDYKIIFYHFHKLSQKHLKYLFGQETTH